MVVTLCNATCYLIKEHKDLPLTSPLAIRVKPNHKRRNLSTHQNHFMEMSTEKVRRPRKKEMTIINHEQ